MINRNDPCWCGSGIKWKKCHFPVAPQRGTTDLAADYKKRYGILIKTPEQIEGIRTSCKLAAKILDETCKAAIAGATTEELNTLAHQLHLDAGAIPAPLNYGSPPYPKSICTSLNEVICHGIPGDYILEEGDIINIDVTCILDGYYGDCSRMVTIGDVDHDKKLVTEVSYECMMRAISILKPGRFIYEIGEVIESYALAHNCSVVNQFVGHGVGINFHEPPQIPHHFNEVKIPIAEGMIFTIEPMINAGVREGIVDADKWTTRTADGKPSAQWEHTILITDTGHEVLSTLEM